MNKSIPYGRQHITQQDIDQVINVLRSDYLTQGPEIEKFEKAFAEYIGSKYAVAVANGTAALHLCALALNVDASTNVITTPLTFAASANCIRYCGGQITFADIDAETWLIDINHVKALLSEAPKGTYGGIIPVDFAGRAVNLEEFRKLADEHNLWIIEDACHAPGGFFTDSAGKKQNCGNGAFSDLSIFSFHPVKHIAAGEGGMITTNNEALCNRLLELRTHGITKSPEKFTNSKNIALGFSEGEAVEEDYPGWYMEMQQLGYNYRLTDFQAALGLSQLSRADENIEKRKQIAKKYADAFEGKSDIKRQAGFVDGHAYHLYVIEVEDRLGLYNKLRKNSIYAQIHYIPLHLMPYYKEFGWKKGDLPKAEQYYAGCISLPIYPTLEEKEQDFVIQCINSFYG